MNTARPPRGLLSEWAWAAIARLHAAGDGGLVLGFDGKMVRAVPWWERAPAWNTIVRLRNRKVPYVQELKVDGESCVRLTAAGRAGQGRLVTSMAWRRPALLSVSSTVLPSGARANSRPRPALNTPRTA